jgi:hypothetical protein
MTKHTKLYAKVSGLAAWSENCKWYSSLPLGAVISLFCVSLVSFAAITRCGAPQLVFVVIAYIVDACALTSIQPSLSLIDMIHCTADKKATSASIFRLIWISLLHDVIKRVRNRTAHSVVFSVVQTVMKFDELGEFRLR